MEELTRVPKWARRFHRVLRELDPALVEYKGLERFRAVTVDYLGKFDDGTPTSPGVQSELTGL